MKTHPLHTLAALGLLLMMTPHNAPAKPTADHLAEEMTAAAKNFLAALDEEQRAEAQLEFENEAREDWHFVPRRRAGLELKQMRADQRQLAHLLLNSALSHRGYFKAVTIMTLEQILREMEESDWRDPELYYVAIFGEPGGERWGWRVEGHHLSVNLTLAGGKVIAQTPSFLGSNPAEVKQGPREGLKVLAGEEDLARELVKSLIEEQREKAVIENRAPRDIITGADRKVDPLEPLGIGYADLNATQQGLLRDLVREYLTTYREELAGPEWQRVEAAGLDKLHFAWAGGFEPGEKHYYRVQGAHFLLEYDNTQNQANHVHCVWRDFENDFGRDILREHYEHGP
jgi:hypothetical protein